jgi:hypothetical protein
VVDEGRERRVGERRPQRHGLVEPAAAQLAQDALGEPAVPAQRDGGVDHVRDVDLQAGARRPDDEAVAPVLDVQRALERPDEPGIQQCARLGGVEPADVDAGDRDARGDRVRVRLVPEVGVGAAGRRRHTGERQRDARCDQEAAAHVRVVLPVTHSCKSRDMFGPH